jgi:hypothetical protein
MHPMTPRKEVRMTVRKLDKKEWQTYFDRISRGLEAEEAEIEVMSLALGDQVEAEWLPLLGITYEPRSDMLEVVLDGLDHMIAKPHEIYVDEQPRGLASIEIVGAEGVRQVVKLRDKLLLPAR